MAGKECRTTRKVYVVVVVPLTFVATFARIVVGEVRESDAVLLVESVPAGACRHYAVALVALLPFVGAWLP